MKKLMLIGFAATLFGLTSCEKFDYVKKDITDDKKNDVVCTTSIEPGVVLYLGTETGKPVFVEGKLLNLKTGEVEYLKVDEKQSTQPVNALYEKPGVYDIYLYAKGYEPVVLKDVMVDKDVCHVKTVHLKAYFQLIKTDKTTDVITKDIIKK